MYTVLEKTSNNYLRTSNRKRKNKRKCRKKAKKCFSADYAVLVPKDHANMYYPMRYYGKRVILETIA